MNDLKNTNTDHRQAITNLNFVHEALASSDHNAGSRFVHRSEFGQKDPSIRVTIDADATEIHAFDGYLLDWVATFTPETPRGVINQAVAAAMAERR